MNGWIKLHRQILENPIARKPSYAWLWTTLLLMANHADNEFIWNGKKQVCKAGQILTGRTALALQTGLSPSTVENILKYLETEQQIEQRKTTKFRLITIKKWKDYQLIEQQFGQQNNNRITTERQQNDTNKKNKNVKNDKNEKNKTTSYGRADINEVLSFLKEQMKLPMLDRSEKDNRFAAKRLIDKLTKLKDHDSAMLNIREAIKFASVDDFWKTKVTSVHALEQHIVTILANGMEKMKKQTVVHI